MHHEQTKFINFEVVGLLAVEKATKYIGFYQNEFEFNRFKKVFDSVGQSEEVIITVIDNRQLNYALFPVIFYKNQ